MGHWNNKQCQLSHLLTVAHPSAGPHQRKDLAPQPRKGGCPGLAQVLVLVPLRGLKADRPQGQTSTALP